MEEIVRERQIGKVKRRGRNQQLKEEVNERETYF